MPVSRYIFGDYLHEVTSPPINRPLIGFVIESSHNVQQATVSNNKRCVLQLVKSTDVVSLRRRGVLALPQLLDGRRAERRPGLMTGHRRNEDITASNSSSTTTNMSGPGCVIRHGDSSR